MSTVHSPTPSSPKTAQGEAAAVTPAPEGAGRILIVDDDADSRAYAESLLATRHQVETAADGAEALAKLKAGSFDLVLADAMTPRVDGIELVRRMRADPALSDLPVVLLSARGGEDAPDAGIAEGADDCLIKPFTARELLMRVSAHLRLARLRAESARERAALLAREREAREEAEALREAQNALIEGLDIHAIVQKATDIATRLTGARFGSFFYRVDRAPGAGFELFTLSGAPREAFARLGRPRPTAIFAPTFDGEGPVRIHDVLVDPRYGTMAPHHGMPAGHLEVRSYLAVPVISRGGRIHGGLFFGHPEPGVFTERSERLATAVAAQTALALDNAALYDDARQSAERLTLALGAARLGDWHWDAATDLVTLSPRAAELFGIPPGPHMTWTAMQLLLHEEDRERARLAVEAAVREGIDYDAEYRVRRPSGDEVWIAARGRAIRGPDGQPTSMLGVVQDISERKAGEAKLLDHQQRLAAALSAGATGTFVWSVRTNRLMCDDSLHALLGLPPGSTTTFDGLLARIHPDDRSKVGEASRRSVTQGADFDEEFHVVHPDGSTRCLHGKGRVFRDEHGQPDYMAGACADITERRHGEDLMARQKDMLQRILGGEALPEILERIAVSVEEFCQRPSTALLLLTDPGGRHLRPAAGRRCPDPFRRAVDPVAIGPASSTCGRAAHLKTRVVTEDITTDPGWTALRDDARGAGFRSCWSTPIVASSGDVLGTLAVYQGEASSPTRTELHVLDMLVQTAAIAIERWRADQQLHEHAAELERAVEERTASLTETIGQLEAFSYSVSHDMRAPLRAMQGYADALMEELGPSLDEQGRRHLERISHNARRLEALVRDVLSYSRVAKGDISLEAIDMDAFVANLVAQHSHLQPPALTLSVDSPLLPVLGHQAYLSQVLTNLLGNAVKFTRPGKPARARISCTPAGAMARFVVADEGIGIDPAHFERIFTIFGRVHPDKLYEGTGIGLSIVKKAIERMGGAVGVESKLGEGTRFWFTLKRA